MKIMSRVIVVVLGIAFVGFGCGHGQITDSTYLPGGGASGADGDDGLVISYTDPSGATLEGDLDPGKAIIINFDVSVSDINATMICDGKLVELVLVPLSETQYQVMSATGVFPQKTTCTLSVNTGASVSGGVAAVHVSKAYYQQEFVFDCAPWDDFSNAKTFDVAATPYDIGTGCWATNMNINEVADFGFILDDVLMITMGDVEGEPDFGSLPYLAKRLSGDFEVELRVSDLGYNMGNEGGGAYALFVTAEPLTPDIGPENIPDIYMVMYTADWIGEEEGFMDYRCQGGLNNFEGGEEGNCGDGSQLPVISILRKGSTLSGRYRVEDGDAWGHVEPAIQNVGEDFEGPLYMYVVFFSRNAYVHFDAFETVGAELAW